MKIRVLFLTLAFAFAAIPALLAKNVTKEQARTVAQNYINERIICHQIDWNADNLALSDVTTFETEGQPAIYAFSNNGVGFILISADDALTPVFGYTDKGSISAPGVNPNLDDLLSEYILQVKYVRTNSLEATSEIQNLWNTYTAGQTNRSVLTDVTVGPLVSTLWDQGFPYNELCPVEPSGVHSVPTGCVATAMSQIMNYYKFPITGSGQHSYNASGYGVQTVNFGTTTYEWDQLQNVMNGSNGDGILAVATLMYHAGVSVNMHYAIGGSGAYSTDVPNALKTYFKYSAAAQYVARSGYTTVNWENMLTEQLDANRPIYYSGSNADGGHAWVCDGYQLTGATKMFHFNFGWSGQSNGYYTSTNPDGFITGQAMVRNIYPGSGYPYGCTAKTLELSKGSIEDGSGPLALYNNNLGCTWLIAPVDTVNSITASFIRFDVSSSDTLYFYNGADESAPLIAAYSGRTLPANVISPGNKMFIKFVTDATVQDTGWLIEFNSVLPNLCGGTKIMLEPSGSFTDGSGPYNYKNNSLCKFKIQPPYAADLTLTFDEFDLLDGDQMVVYALSNNALIATLTGTTLPAPITVPFNGLYIVFQSNSYYTGTGFSASYSVGNVGNKKLPGISSLSISPNPASDFIMVRAYNNKSQQIQLTLSDMTGKSLYIESYTALKGNIEKSIDVSNLTAGMYLLTLKSPEGIVTEKVIVK